MPSAPADTSISGLAAYAIVHADDLFIVVDVHDTSMAGSGTDKKATIAQIFGSPSNGQLIGWSGGIPSPLSLGTNLSITSGALNATGGGTVTTASIASANGFAGTVANPTTTPAITITTTATGILKGNGTAIAAATAGTDYQAPITLTTTGSSGAATFSGNTLNVPQYSGGGGSGTVNSGTAGQIAVFPSSGTAVSGTSTPIVPTVTATYASTTNFDLSQSNNQQVTLTGNPTLTASNATVGQRFTINLIQDGTGSRTVTWFSGITWAGGSAPTLQTAPGAIDTVSFWCVSSGVYQGYPASVPVPGTSGQMIYNNGTALAGAANAKIDGNSLFNIGSAVSDPGTQIQGSLYPSSTGGLTYAAGPGSIRRIRGRIFSCASCTAVSNTTAWTSIFGSPTGADGSLTIKANTLRAGDVLSYDIFGVWQNVNQPVTINHEVYLGSTLVTQGPSSPPITYNQSVNGMVYTQFNKLLAVSVGASGGIVGMTDIALIGSGGGTINSQGYSGIGTESGTPITVDTTVDQLFDIRFAWGTAATGNIFQVTGFSLRIN